MFSKTPQDGMVDAYFILTMANNEDSLAVESSDNVSEQEGKILEISGETKFFIKTQI